MKVSVAVPARLGSSRFPRKILEPLGGIPVLRRVLERVAQVEILDEVIALVDDSFMLKLVRNWGFSAILTEQSCTSGTERIASAIDRIKGDFIINVQGDEPFISTDLLRKISEYARSSPPVEVLTAVYPIKDPTLLTNSNRIKVVLDTDGKALYFSRTPIPFVRNNAVIDEWTMLHDFWGHVGVYGYSRSFLERYFSLKKSVLEQAECLEQLKFLENGIAIYCVKVDEPTIGIDTPEDLIAAENFLKDHPDF